MCKPCVGAKVVLRFQALIAHAVSKICQKLILFISGFGVIVSHFVRGDIFLTHPVLTNINPVNTLLEHNISVTIRETQTGIQCMFI